MRILSAIWSSLLVIGVVLACIAPIPVSAVSNPDSISIAEVRVYEDVIETGDQFYYCRYDLNYASEPSEAASLTFMVDIYSYAAGVYTSMGLATPLHYYQENIISIYLTAAQALGAGTYYFRILGQPAYFPVLTENVNMRSWGLAAPDYYSGTGLCAYLLAQAQVLEDLKGVTYLTTSGKLNATGTDLFETAIPGLPTFCPTIEMITVTYPTMGATGNTSAYVTSLESHAGDRLRAAINSTAIWMGTSFDWMAFFMMAMMFFTMGGIVFASTKSPAAALIFSFPVIIGFAWLGLSKEIFTAMIVIVFILAVLFGVVFILQRFA